MWTGESGYFRIRRRSKFESSLLPNNKPIQQQGKFSATIARFMAHALNTFYCRGALGSTVNPDTIGCVWTGEFDLNTLRVDREIFESGKKKLRIQKYPDTRGWSLRKQKEQKTKRCTNFLRLFVPSPHLDHRNVLKFSR